MAAILKFPRPFYQLTCCVRPLVTGGQSSLNASQPDFSNCRRNNSNRTSITKIKRRQFPKMYPTLLVLPNGASIRIRHKDPRLIIKMPVNTALLSAAEKAYRKDKLAPIKKMEIKEEIEDDFDSSDYLKMFQK